MFLLLFLTLICILKSIPFVNLSIFTYVTFGVYVVSSPLSVPPHRLVGWSFPILTMSVLFFLACARLTLLVYNTCRSRLRGKLWFADRTSPLPTCLGKYIGSQLDKELYTNSCCMSTKPLMIWLLVTYLPWRIFRTLMPLNIGNDCEPLQIRPGWLFPDLSNEPVIWAFFIAAARLLNELPVSCVSLRESLSLPMFKGHLKTHLFS